jgi:GNAT superfamily N-acetyltransferase
VSWWLDAVGKLDLQPAKAADFESLLALRFRAMQPSLQALGRFDPERARERFAATFLPEFMQHIVVDDDRVGCVSLRPKPDALRIDHLYIDPAWQRRQIGSWVMDWACASADLRQQTLQLAMLQGSDAIRFYQRHQFFELQRGEFDIELRRAPAANPLQVLASLWSHFQARDWAAARALLHDDLRVRWWASGEILDADAFISANAEYPDGWAIELQNCVALQDGRVMSMVRVVHPPGYFLAQSIARVRHGRIASIDELWATCEEPPAWRTPERYAGLQRVPGWPAA